MPERHNGPMARLIVTFATTAGRRAGQELLRVRAAEFCGASLASTRLAQRCRRCASTDHGQPYVVMPVGAEAPYVSLSRVTGPGLLLLAVTDAGPVGVDLEPAGAASFVGFDAVALHPAERAGTDAERTRTWVRKESVLKATGHGLAVDPRQLRLSAPGQAPEVLTWPEALGPELRRPAWLFDLDLGSAPAGYVGAVTVLAANRPTLTLDLHPGVPPHLQQRDPAPADRATRGPTASA